MNISFEIIRDPAHQNSINNGSSWTKNGEAKVSHNTLSSSLSSSKTRNLIGFWILGLCNNFGYVVMISAAHDILKTQAGTGHHNKSNGTVLDQDNVKDLESLISTNHTNNNGIHCNHLSTGAILLADILPTLIIKYSAPYFMNKIKYSFRFAAIVTFAIASYVIVGCSQLLWISILGVVCASISSGFGEINFLSLSSHFDRNVVSTWSSGTGAAGLFGAFSYAGMTSAGISPKTSILIMNIVPVWMIITYYCILQFPQSLKTSSYSPLLDSDGIGTEREPLTFREMLTITKSLALKFILPLSLVYYAEYLINQGLHELIYWNGIWLTPAAQYRWYQVDYQLGVLISRSSVNVIKINKIWFIVPLQYINLALLFTEAYYHYMPSIWIVLAIVLFEGLLGGAIYVNAFYRISTECPSEHKEFSMGVTSVGDSTGIALAGVTALPLHDFLCKYWMTHS